MTRRIEDLDVPESTLREQIAALVARQNGDQPDPRVGQNPTGRPRRSSAGTRRKHERRDGRGEAS